jgi:branched-chain amino acid transport system ATP-binding protein
LFQNLTVEENVILGAYLRRDKKSIGEDLEFVYNLFPVLKERRKQQAGTLSGGEQQMVAIARSIMSGPSLLMLDEPSLGLSPLMREKIFKAIKELNVSRGTTILLVEQDVSDALSLSEFTYVLEGGHIVMRGKSKDISQRPEIRKAYLGL